MTLELAARLAVLLACAVAIGALYVRLAGPRSVPADPPMPGVARPIRGAVDATLVAFVVVAGGAAIAGIAGGVGDGPGIVLLRAAGIVLLAAAGVLALVPLRRRGRLGPQALIGLAWLGAGAALLAPLVLIVAALAIVLLAVRVEDRPRP